MTTCVVEESPALERLISALEDIIAIAQKDGTRIKRHVKRLRLYGLEK